MRRISSIPVALILALFAGCTGWKMDYADPVVHILAEDLASKGSPYLGKKIAVKGKVESVDTTNPKSCWVILEGNVKCHYGDFQGMVFEIKTGEVIVISGILESISKTGVLIDPAMGRDPLAPFDPLK
ncbi:MAG: hypothetical protein CBC13_02800 [Planctomycetia bacterium TMED53]|nr:MAG: hypothetical protein CBC13_02800 [Planctomycetia bacterium TMED53]